MLTWTVRVISMKDALTWHKYARPGLQLTKWRTCCNVLTLVLTSCIVLYPVVVMACYGFIWISRQTWLCSWALGLFGSSWKDGALDVAGAVHFSCHFCVIFVSFLPFLISICCRFLRFVFKFSMSCILCALWCRSWTYLCHICVTFASGLLSARLWAVVQALVLCSS